MRHSSCTAGNGIDGWGRRLPSDCCMIEGAFIPQNALRLLVELICVYWNNARLVPVGSTFRASFLRLENTGCFLGLHHLPLRVRSVLIASRLNLAEEGTALFINVSMKKAVNWLQ